MMTKISQNLCKNSRPCVKIEKIIYSSEEKKLKIVRTL